MIGSGLKKLAQEKGLNVASGVAYGSLDGYAATMNEGSGWKGVTLTTKFTDVQKQNELLALCNGRDLQKEFRIQSLRFASNGIQVVFTDNPGTMKKIEAFLDWFMSLLPQYGATGVNVCPQCGLEIVDGGCWKLVGDTALHMHAACAEKLVRDIRAEEAQEKENDSGSLIGGLVGALGGSLLGSIVWALVLSAGYVASLVGLLIGFLAEKGYTLLRGKKSKAKVAILILATVVGVLVGTIGGDIISLARMIASGEAGFMTYGDIPGLLVEMLAYDSQYLTGVLANMGMGLLFAGLGIWSLVRRTGKEVSAVKVVDLS